MTKKIQTEFSRLVLEKARKELKGLNKYRPKSCTAPKKCIFLARLVGEPPAGFLCTGFWDCRDEDIVRFCLSTVDSTLRMRITPCEASEIVEILQVPVRIGLLYGIPDYEEVMANFMEMK